MSNEADQAPDRNSRVDDSVASKGAANSSRRRLIKGGLSATAPVILTLTSRPVLGFQQACVAPSRMISGNFSGFAGLNSCNGTSLATRNIQALSNPKPAWYNTKFTDVFSPMYVNGNNANVQDKLGEVFLDSYGDGDKYGVPKFAAYIIAAYLNAFYGDGSVRTVLTTARVQQMWKDVVASTRYCPQVGMCWDALGVIGYLENSGIVPSA